jgi:superfamily I DNA and/or RNA helicase
MARHPLESVLIPAEAFTNGLRSGTAPITSSEDLTAITTLAHAFTKQYQPVLASEFMWVQILTYSFFRLHRLWGMASQVVERETNHATIYQSLEYDDLRPVIEQNIQSIQNDIKTLQDTFKRVLEVELPLVAMEQALCCIAENSPPTVQNLFANCLQALKNAPEELGEAVEAVLQGLREEIAKHRGTITEIEAIRSRLAEVKISTSAIHKDSDRLLNQEIKLIATIEKCEKNLAKSDRQRKAKTV